MVSNKYKPVQNAQTEKMERRLSDLTRKFCR